MWFVFYFLENEMILHCFPEGVGRVPQRFMRTRAETSTCTAKVTKYIKVYTIKIETIQTNETQNSNVSNTQTVSMYLP